MQKQTIKVSEELTDYVRQLGYEEIKYLGIDECRKYLLPLNEDTRHADVVYAWRTPEQRKGLTEPTVFVGSLEGRKKEYSPGYLFPKPLVQELVDRHDTDVTLVGVNRERQVHTFDAVTALNEYDDGPWWIKIPTPSAQSTEAPRKRPEWGVVHEFQWPTELDFENDNPKISTLKRRCQNGAVVVINGEGKILITYASFL